MDIEDIKRIFNKDTITFEDLFWCMINVSYSIIKKNEYTPLNEKHIKILKEFYICENLRIKVLEGFKDYNYINKTRINTLFQLAKGCQALINCEDVISYNNLGFDPLILLRIEDQDIKLKKEEIDSIFNCTSIENIFCYAPTLENIQNDEDIDFFGRIIRYLPGRIPKNTSMYSLIKLIEEDIKNITEYWELIKIIYFGIGIENILMTGTLIKLGEYEEYIIDIPLENPTDLETYSFIFDRISCCKYYKEEDYNKIVEKYTSDKKYEERLKLLLSITTCHIIWDLNKKPGRFFSPFFIDSSFFDLKLIDENSIPNHFLDTFKDENLLINEFWKKRNYEKLKNEVWENLFSGKLENEVLLSSYFELDKYRNYVFKNLNGFDFILYGETCSICLNVIKNPSYLCIFSCKHILCGFCRKKISGTHNYHGVYIVNCPSCRRNSQVYYSSGL